MGERVTINSYLLSHIKIFFMAILKLIQTDSMNFHLISLPF
jgi:hypothetical protein